MDCQLSAGMDNEVSFGNILSKYGLTKSSSSFRSHPLHLAVGIPECVQELISVGASVNKRYNMWTALAFALRDGNMDSASTLVAHGAQVNSSDKFGYTDLMWAAKVCDTEQVSFLLSHGAGVNIVNQNQESALILAAAHNKIDNVSCLVQFGADIQIADSTGWTALFWASFNGNVNILRYLLTVGASVSVHDKDGETALQKAVFFRHMKCAALLHASGAEYPHNDAMQNDQQKGRDINKPDSLKHSCRIIIRKHLLEVHKDNNLFSLVKSLEYPSSLKQYILFGYEIQ